MKKADFNFFVEVIEKRLEENSCFTWGEIVDDITGTKHEPKNWLDVRGVLQAFINEGIIERTEDLTVEKYILIKA